jgi:adenylate kinase family enzyme
MIKRIKERCKFEQRIDDSLETLERRYIGYLNETLPMVNELAQRSPVIIISGRSNIEKVNKSICDKIKYLL